MQFTFSEQQLGFDGLKEVADAIRYLADRAYPTPKPPKPKPFSITLISERRENDMDILRYRANFPSVPANTDVTTQNFSVTVDGAPSAHLGGVQDGLAKDVTTAEFEVPQGANVGVSLVYVDDAGNLSTARTQEFVAADSIAPDAPGDLGAIDLIGERTE